MADKVKNASLIIFLVSYSIVAIVYGSTLGANLNSEIEMRKINDKDQKEDIVEIKGTLKKIYDILFDLEKRI